MATKSILIVDDDAHIRDVIRYTLEKEDIVVWEAENGVEGYTLFDAHKPDIIILDILMPEMSGLDLCKTIRKTSEVPIIFLSSMDDEIDRIIGFEVGGDDYLAKPFSPRELIARVKVIYKRLLPIHPAEQKILNQGELLIDLNTYQVTWQGQVVVLTSTEFNLLEVFMRYPQKVYTRNELMDADIFKDIITDRTIDSHIRRLRKKLVTLNCPEVIETVHGFGYKLGKF